MNRTRKGHVKGQHWGSVTQVVDKERLKFLILQGTGERVPLWISSLWLEKRSS